MIKLKKRISGSQLLSLRFLLSVAILFAAATGLRPGLQALEEHYMKEPIAIRKALKDFDFLSLPSFRKGWDFIRKDTLKGDIGTDEFLYLDLMATDIMKNPDHFVLFVTYYSNPGDKIPHTPEVCSRQAGAIVRKMSTFTIDTPQLAPEYPSIKARLLILEKPEHYNIVAYVFFVEGHFRYSREQARWVIATPGNRHVYFSKIEAATFCPIGGDLTAGTDQCKNLLREALAVLLKEHFPLTEQLKR